MSPGQQKRSLHCASLRSENPVWTLNGDVNKPTFNPSVRIAGKQTVRDAEGNWTGEWARDADGNPVDRCCHYFLKEGQLQFLGDCTHALKGQTVPLPELPSWLRD
ncbi:MAG TPA: DUF6527 family protein [Reyranella sp.]|nr:DUF6527 family protein [Reyranella sp.]